MSPSTTAASAQFIQFEPTKEAASDILCAMVDPDQTLAEIARRFHTTLDALADWLDTPSVLARIEKMKRIAATRDELILAAHLRNALAVLISLIEAHQHDEQHIPVDPQNLKAVTQRDRRRAAARLAASQLIRLANHPTGPGGTGVPPVQSAQGPNDSGTRPRRTPTTPNSPTPQSQAVRLCHTDHQTNNSVNPDPSPAHPHGHDDHPPVSEQESALRSASENEGVQSPHGQHDHSTAPQAPPRRGEEISAQGRPPPDRR